MQLKYHLLPGRCPPHYEAQEFHDRVFLFWKGLWDQVLHDLDGGVTSASEFDRQNVIGVITNGDDIVSAHLYSHFSAKSLAARSHGYFTDSYEPQFREWLEGLGDASVMSMEYLSLNPSYRKSKLGISLAHVIIGLGTKVQRDLGANWAIAPCRQDVHVDEIARQFGSRGFEPRQMHNVPVVSMILASSEIRTCPLLTEARLIETMWAQKQDLRTQNKEVTTTIKEAA